MVVGQRRTNQTGMTLIEVLIAGVVLSIGLLGVFQLHVFSKRSSYASINYSQATMMAADMVDRIRLNPAQRDNYIFNNYGAATITLPSKSCNKTSGVINQCTPTEMTNWDQYQWDQELSGRSERVGSTNIGVAEDVTGCVFVVGNDVEVVVSWQGLIGSSDAADRSSANAKSCGTSGNKRRQVVISTVVVAAL
ncbi:type IV pilus modification protein PilV [uncultured Ferrimonas sp.]|uniref:type IV pilus modification protein PilV n=1 Tax=uncultured Ferrimonas sp. TaxID=432640 RepID=UPI002626A006|nr:type IV pilus modification protein PilV [uncultured Ferrimonas sp.]